MRKTTSILLEKLCGKIANKIRRVPAPDQSDYNAIHAHRSASFKHPLWRRVLVIGCNTGLDCRYFVDLGASAVHGVDVVDEIGRDFSHSRVTYHQMSVEDMSFPDNTFDIVYSFATMEHVPRIDFGFREMARVLKKGGLIYSVAAPLWNSPQGHHKGNFFADYPWVHLRLARDEILAFCERKGMPDMTIHVDYMLDDRWFNKTRARQYVDVCATLDSLDVVRNDLESVPEETLSDQIYAELEPKGYDRAELLATVHTLIAVKL